MELFVDHVVATPRIVAKQPTLSRLDLDLATLESSPSLTRLVFILADMLAIASACGLGIIAAESVGLAPSLSGGGTVVMGAAGTLLAAYLFVGLYDIIPLHPAEEIRRVIVASAVTSLSFGTYWVIEEPRTGVQLAVLATCIAGLIVMVPFMRLVVRFTCSRWKWWGAAAVIMSFGNGGSDVINTLKRWPDMGLRPAGLLRIGASFGGDGVGLLDDDSWIAPQLANDFHVLVAVIATEEGMNNQMLARHLQRYTKHFRRVYVVQTFQGAPTIWPAHDSTGGLLGFGVQHAAWMRGTRTVKRSIDIVGAAIGLLICAPLFALIGFLIKLSSTGPVFFKQYRLGQSGKTIRVFKFRTMHEDAERRLKDILENDNKAKGEYEVYHKLENDPRITRIGRVLRRTSLDELPQLANVFRGDMSLVGPRAYLPSELPTMEGLQRVILQNRPGITGFWQVSGRNDVSFADRLNLDVHYIHNWSPWLDLYILARTVPVVLGKSGVS